MPVIGLEARIVIVLAALYGSYGVSAFDTHLGRGILCDDKIGSSEKMIIIEVGW